MTMNKRMIAKEIGSYIIWALGGVVVSLILFKVIFGLAIVHGSSMEPNYHEGEVLVFNRLDHSYERGDVIVLKSELLDDHNHQKHLIKRVIAVENDRVSIVDGIVYINGEELYESYINPDHSNMPEQTIGKDQVFVLGDNRPNSNDSRSESVGNIYVQDVDGVVFGNNAKKG